MTLSQDFGPTLTLIRMPPQLVPGTACPPAAAIAAASPLPDEADMRRDHLRYTYSPGSIHLPSRVRQLWSWF